MTDVDTPDVFRLEIRHPTTTVHNRRTHEVVLELPTPANLDISTTNGHPFSADLWAAGFRRSDEGGLLLGNDEVLLLDLEPTSNILDERAAERSTLDPMSADQLTLRVSGSGEGQITDLTGSSRRVVWGQLQLDDPTPQVMNRVRAYLLSSGYAVEADAVPSVRAIPNDYDDHLRELTVEVRAIG